MESKEKGGTALYNTVVAEELEEYEGACEAFKERAGIESENNRILKEIHEIVRGAQ